MCSCSSNSPVAQFAKSYSIAELLKATQNPAASKKNSISSADDKTAAPAGTGLVVDTSA